MTARYIFKVGPANRHSGYAHQVSVLADNYSEAKTKAIAFRGYAPRDTNIWFVSADEVDPHMETLKQLAKLIREGKLDED